MRNPKRIPICLHKFRSKLTLASFLNKLDFIIIENILNNWNLIEKEWLKSPDLRFGQLLVVLNLIPDIDIENHIWNIEETIWLVDNNYCTFEDIHFWGINYFKNGKPRKNVKYKLLRELDINHIKNIIKFFEERNAINKIPQRYLNYFNNRINNE